MCAVQDLVSGYDASQIGAVRPAPRRQKVFGKPWGDAENSHLAPRASAGDPMQILLPSIPLLMCDPS